MTIEVGRAGSGPGATGSGEFFQTGGYILTNNHVVANAANGASSEVVLADGQRRPATLVGRDPRMRTAGPSTPLASKRWNSQP